MDEIKAAVYNWWSCSSINKKLILSGVAAGLFLQSYRTVRKWRRTRMLMEKIAQRKEERKASFAKLLAHLEKLQAIEGSDWERIWGSSFDELIELLRSESVRPLVALHAFQWAALAATEATNCVTMFFPEADAAAAQLHDDWAGKDPKPRLYGLPVSIKENIMVKGQDSTLGYAGGLFRPKEEDALIVQLLRGAGAVPFVGTNLPQGTGAFSSANPVYGNTSNPYAADRTAGGSTGGEGALVALGGSPLGIGSDILGSIRVPCHFCGITGFKSTSHRMTAMGTNFAMPGVQGLFKAAGGMAQDPAAILALHRFLWAPQPNPLYADPTVAPIAFDEEMLAETRPLRIGFYEEDGFLEPTPAMRRAVREAKAALEAQGHELVAWSPPGVSKGWLATLRSINPDGYMLIQKANNDIPEPMYRNFYKEGFLRFLNRCILPPKFHVMASTAGSSGTLRSYHAEVTAWRASVMAGWTSAGLDALLCPPCSAPAFPSELAPDAFMACSYTGIFNSLDCPAAVVPWTRVRASDEAAMGGVTRVLSPNRLVDLVAGSLNARLVAANQSGTVGLPVGVQVSRLLITRLI